MSENIWDPESYSVGSFLEGKRGVIREPEFVRHNCRGHCQETGALRFRVVLPDVAEEKQPYPVDYNVGKDFWPSEDGKSKAVTGNRIISMSGRKVDKKTKFFLLRQSLAQAGFPLEKLGEDGAMALDGADVTFRAIERQFNIKGEQVDSVADVVAEFHGFVDGDGGGSEEAGGADQEELVAELSTALIEALDANKGEIPRAQISIRLNKALKDNPNRAEILALAAQDEVLGQIDGITFDKKVLKLEA